MEPAWEKVHGRKFALMFREVKIGNGAVRRDPCYQLTKTECLYIATKFNDEARAKLNEPAEDTLTATQAKTPIARASPLEPSVSFYVLFCH